MKEMVLLCVPQRALWSEHNTDLKRETEEEEWRQRRRRRRRRRCGDRRGGVETEEEEVWRHDGLRAALWLIY